MTPRRSDPTRRARRTWPQRLLIVAASLLVVAFVGTAAGLSFYDKQLGEIPRVALSEDVLAETSDPLEPKNYLIVGVDNAEGLASDDPVVRGRNRQSLLSDTIMILRVDPTQEQAYLLSLPRDLWVPIAGTRRKGRINEALPLGGPERLIQTIQTDFGIPINHYVQVNFQAFRSIVDTVGGVPIYFNHPARDKNTGLSVPEAGCQVLDGTTALQFARSRYYEANIDGRWVADPSSDFGRIERQQAFIKAAMRRAIDKGARNPLEANRLLGIAQEQVVLDDALTPEGILALAEKFNTFDPEQLQTFTPPARGGMAGAASVLYLDERGAQPIFDLFRGVTTAADSPSLVRVQVRNGTGTRGQGTVVRDQLAGVGFTVVGTSDDRNFRNERTVVRYAPGAEAAAAIVVRWLPVTPVLEVDPSLAGADADVVVVTGRDWAGVRAEPLPIEAAQALVPTTTAPPTSLGQTPDTTVLPDGSRTREEFIPAPPPGTVC